MRKEPLTAEEVKRLQRRWGLYTLGCLTVAFLALMVSTAQGYYTFATVVCLGGGLAGAAYCTWQGLKKASRFRI
ncbi:MAG: hypothetical protein ACJ71T_04200 [Actinomycetales bacterium]